ncbi:MAG: response regulator [Candidatus Saganbacteria bacterium]|nr:response regulator [Candidatus Saganbacteria bacterium]
MDKPVVLVVDDEKDARDTISEVLSKECEVDTADGGKAALSKLNEKKYHIVLLDIRMPEMDGMEVLKKIKGQYSGPNKIEIIMLTAFDEAKLAWEASKLGASDFITKPFRNEDLIFRVKLAAKRKMDDDLFLQKVMLANHIFVDSSKEDPIFARRKLILDALYNKNNQDIDKVKLEDLEAIRGGKWDNIEPEKI